MLKVRLKTPKEKFCKEFCDKMAPVAAASIAASKEFPDMTKKELFLYVYDNCADMQGFQDWMERQISFHVVA